MKKIVFLLFCLMIASSSIESHEKNYMHHSLTKIVEEINGTNDIYKTALCYENLDKWFKLFAKLELPPEEKHQILLETREEITQLSDKFLDFLDHLYKEDHDTISVQYEGQSAKAFINLDSNRFNQEKESYQEYGVFKPISLDSRSLTNVKLNTCYNFVVTPQGKVVLGDLQEYDELMTGDKKILLAPNHALLANGNPVMTAGEIILMGDHKFQFWMVGMTSGHYHPTSKSKKYIIDGLVKLGIPKEQIIVFGFHIYKLPWKLLENDKAKK